MFRFIGYYRERERERDTLNENNLSIDFLRLLSTSPKKKKYQNELFKHLRTSSSERKLIKTKKKKKIITSVVAV